MQTVILVQMFYDDRWFAIPARNFRPEQMDCYWAEKRVRWICMEWTTERLRDAGAASVAPANQRAEVVPATPHVSRSRFDSLRWASVRYVLGVRIE